MTSANLTSNALSTPCFWNQCFCIDVANIAIVCKFQEFFSNAKMVWLHLFFTYVPASDFCFVPVSLKITLQIIHAVKFELFT